MRRNIHNALTDGINDAPTDYIHDALTEDIHAAVRLNPAADHLRRFLVFFGVAKHFVSGTATERRSRETSRRHGPELARRRMSA